MQTDTFLEIGSQHKICEDYIVSSADPIPFIIISDGCSSSKNTEMGSRIIAHLAKQYLKYRKYDIPSINYYDMGSFVINNAETVARQLGLNNTCLDSTLIVSFEIDDKVYIYFYGDGVLFLKNKNGIISKKIEYTNNAPYYLSYLIDSKRRKLYEEMKNDKILITITDDNTSTNLYAYDYGWAESYDLNEYPCIAICSDGISSFISNNTNINDETIIPNFLSFKTTKGEFLKRRSLRYLKEQKRKGIYHFDDLSIGVFLKE